jgi:hypothetical protein
MCFIKNNNYIIVTRQLTVRVDDGGIFLKRSIHLSRQYSEFFFSKLAISITFLLCNSYPPPLPLNHEIILNFGSSVTRTCERLLKK